MSAPVTEHALFAALRGFASTLEVQFMIEEELKKFQEKTLPKLLSDTVGSASKGSNLVEASPSSPAPKTGEQHNDRAHPVSGVPVLASSPAHPTSSTHSSTPDAEWVRTFLKAHIDDTVARRLPTMIAQEVQRQLRGVTAAVAQGDVPAASPSSSPKECGGGGGGGAEMRTAMGLPPLPPPPSSAASPSSPLRPPRRHEDDARAVRSSSSGTCGAAPRDAQLEEKNARLSTPASSATEVDDARRQRERILSAVEDIERQVNGLQRVVDAVVEERDLRGRRWAYLSEVVDKKMKAVMRDEVGEEALTVPLQVRLERLLDEEEEAALLTMLETALACLQPRRQGTTLEGGADSLKLQARSLSFHAHEHASSSSPVLSSRRRYSSSETAPQPPPPQPPQQDTPETSPMRGSEFIGRGSLFSSEPPSPPPMAPVSSATRRRADVPPSTLEAATTSAAVGQHPPPVPHVSASSGKGVRSITTKGSVVTSPSSAALASSKGPPAFAADGVTPLAEAAPVSDGAAAAAAVRHNGLNGTAVRRPAPSPRACVDAALHDGHSANTGEGRARDSAHRAFLKVAAATSPSASLNLSHWTLDPAVGGGPSQNDETSSILPSSTSRSKMTTAMNSASSASATAAAAAAAAAARAIKLGIDAVNVPPGVLPDALGSHGAVRVQSVTPQQLAEKAGLCRGDILLSLDGRTVRSCEELRDALAAVPPSQDTVTVELYRHTAHQILTVMLKI